MLIVTGAVSVKPGNEAAMRDVGLAHVRRSRLEDGCILHSMAQDCEDPLRLVFHEQWRDMAALKTHFRQLGSLEFIARVRELCTGHEPVVIYAAELAG